MSPACPGAWYLSVPASGSKQEAAKDFIAFAYEHNDLSADTSLGLVARKSAFESKASEPGFENYPALLDTLEAPQTLPGRQRRSGRRSSTPS